MLLFCFILLLVIHIPDVTRKHRNFEFMSVEKDRAEQNSFITLETLFQPNMEPCRGGRIHNHLFVIFFPCMCVCLWPSCSISSSSLFFLSNKHSRHYTVVYGLHIYCLMFSDNFVIAIFLCVIKYLWITVTFVFYVFKRDWLFPRDNLQVSVVSNTAGTGAVEVTSPSQPGLMSSALSCSRAINIIECSFCVH